MQENRGGGELSDDDSIVNYSAWRPTEVEKRGRKRRWEIPLRGDRVSLCLLSQELLSDMPDLNTTQAVNNTYCPLILLPLLLH